MKSRPPQAEMTTRREALRALRPGDRFRFTRTGWLWQIRFKNFYGMNVHQITISKVLPDLTVDQNELRLVITYEVVWHVERTR